MVKFIAEVSSNHAQDLGRSLAFVDAAADCGFDAVKFQLFRVAELFAPGGTSDCHCLGRSAVALVVVGRECIVSRLFPAPGRGRC